MWHSVQAATRGTGLALRPRPVPSLTSYPGTLREAAVTLWMRQGQGGTATAHMVPRPLENQDGSEFPPLHQAGLGQDCPEGLYLDSSELRLCFPESASPFRLHCLHFPFRSPPPPEKETGFCGPGPQRPMPKDAMECGKITHST